MPQQLQSTVAVGLVLTRSHEIERRRVRAGFAHGHAEAVVERAVGSNLRAASDAACAAERIRMVEAARRAAPLAQTRRVSSRTVGKHCTCRTAAVGLIGLRARTVSLLRSQIVAVVDEAVGSSCRIGDTRDAVLHIIRQRGRIGSPDFDTSTLRRKSCQSYAANALPLNVQANGFAIVWLK